MARMVLVRPENGIAHVQCHVQYRRDRSSATPVGKTIQPGWVRIVHWINAVAMILMIMSGWQIYNASPLFEGLRFSHSITLGGWLGGALLWHFAAMWLLMVNGLIYLTLGLVTGVFAKNCCRSRPAA